MKDKTTLFEIFEDEEGVQVYINPEAPITVLRDMLSSQVADININLTARAVTGSVMSAFHALGKSVKDARDIEAAKKIIGV